MLCVFLFFSSSYLLDPEPVTFMDSHTLAVTVGPLQSSKFSLPLPFNIEDLFCVPSDFKMTTTLFDNIIGMHSGPSVFKYIPNKENHKCKSTCRKTYTKQQKAVLFDLIDKHYKIFLYADGMPCSVKYSNATEGQQKYTYGYDIGFKEGKDKKRGLSAGLHYMYTHLNITFHLHRDYALGVNTVMDFEIKPIAPPNKPPCTFEFADSLENATDVLFTYNMNHDFIDEKRETRWKRAVEKVQAPEINWAMIANSIIASLTITVIFYALFVQYIKSIVTDSNGQQLRGWKSLRADVFRPPRYSLKWAGLVSNGAHLFISSFILLILGATGVLSPAKPSSVPKIFFTIYVIFTVVSGFLNQYLYAAAGSSGKKFATLKTTLYSSIIPLVFYTIIVIIDSFDKSLEYLPLNNMIIIVFSLLGCISLNAIGTILCVVLKRFKGIGECSAFPRKMPPQPFCLVHEVTETIIGFIVFFSFMPMLDTLIKYVWVPFGLWKIWGVFLGSYSSALALSSILSVSIIYIRLNHEDYEWWWTSFKGPLMSALFVFLHIMKTFMLNMDSTNICVSAVYIMKALAFSLIFGLSCGAVGCLSVLVLIRYMYNKKN